MKCGEGEVSVGQGSTFGIYIKIKRKEETGTRKIEEM
jgi:hypothetical protein